jgi:hypothetical protein
MSPRPRDGGDDPAATSLLPRKIGDDLELYRSMSVPAVTTVPPRSGNLVPAVTDLPLRRRDSVISETGTERRRSVVVPAVTDMERCSGRSVSDVNIMPLRFFCGVSTTRPRGLDLQRGDNAHSATHLRDQDP